ncbi:hypothetical protein DMH27_03000 [Raoultella planticola]|nr:hypothetical protein [Raoultella planticola]
MSPQQLSERPSSLKAIDGTDDSSKLSKIQKQTVSSISALTSGLAGETQDYS